MGTVPVVPATMDNIGLAFLLSFYLLGLVSGDSGCDHRETPTGSECTGCPPMFEGKNCASTTMYDQPDGKSICQCDFPFKSTYTAAANTAMMGASNQQNCKDNCGLCFRLCSTGGTTQGQRPPKGKCIVIQVNNICPDDGWCDQEWSPKQCIDDPEVCKVEGKTNKFGYHAHFDLYNYDHQISEGLNWDNVEVTFEPVECSEGDFEDWDCGCKMNGTPHFP